MQAYQIVLLVVGILALIAILFAVSYVKAPPDTAFIVTGRKKRKVLIGKAGFRIPFLQRLDKLPLNLIQVDIKTPDAVPTSEFINIFVDGVANIKIGSTPEDIALPRRFSYRKNFRAFRQSPKKFWKETCGRSSGR